MGDLEKADKVQSRRFMVRWDVPGQKASEWDEKSVAR